MARTVDKIIREQLGSLMAEVAILTAQKEALEEENIRLVAELKKLNVREPDKNPKSKG